MGTGQSTSEEIMAKVFANSEHSQEELDEEIPDDARGTEEHVSKERELVKEYAWPEGIYEQPELGHVVAEKSAGRDFQMEIQSEVGKSPRKVGGLGQSTNAKSVGQEGGICKMQGEGRGFKRLSVEGRMTLNDRRRQEIMNGHDVIIISDEEG